MGLCKRLFLVLSSVTCVSHGCKDRNTNGNLKHEWGKTRVEPPAELAACTATLKTKFPKASQYLVNLAKIIATANPGTFSGVYDLSKFCFDVYYDPEVGKEANTVNGFAQPWDRRLVLFPTTFTFAKSDADIAGILTHELAHITMYHNGQARQAERVMYQMRNDGEYKRLQADVNRLEEELRHADAGQNDHYEKNKSIFQHLNDDLENDQKYQTLVQKARSSVFSSSYTLQAALGFALWRLTGDPEFAEFDNGYRGQEFEHSGTTIDSLRSRFAQASAEVPKEARQQERDQKQLDEMRMNRAAATGDKALINALKKERQLIAASNVTRDQHRDLERAMQARLDANGLNSAVVSTLKEQEADEVGLELFVRAGFKPEQYGFMQRHYAIHMENSSVFEKAIRLARSNSESELSLECLKIRQLKVMGLPYRGRWTRADEPYRVAPGRTESHPLPCWRLYNIKHNEMKEHADEIAKLGRDVKEPTALTAPSLVEVQAEIGIDPGTVRILGGKGEPGPTPPDSQEKARSRDDEKVERDSGTIEIPVFYPISY